MVQAIRQEAIPYWADAHYEIRFIAIMRTCIYENPLFECLTRIMQLKPGNPPKGQ